MCSLPAVRPYVQKSAPITCWVRSRSAYSQGTRYRVAAVSAILAMVSALASSNAWYSDRASQGRAWYTSRRSTTTCMIGKIPVSV